MSSHDGLAAENVAGLARDLTLTPHRLWAAWFLRGRRARGGEGEFIDEGLGTILRVESPAVNLSEDSTDVGLVLDEFFVQGPDP